jgi:hypothetical protein
MNAEIEGYLDQLLSLRQDAPGIIARLSDQQANWRPTPQRWSIAECLGHLNQSARESTRRVDEAIASGRANGLTASGPFSYPLWERLFVQSLEPPPSPRVRTTAALRPVRDANPADVLREFLDWQDQFAERLRQADGLDLQWVRVKSPVLSWLRYSLGTAFRAFLAHERRHVWQARQVRQELENRRSSS